MARQQYPGDQERAALYWQRTRPALPSTMAPTTPAPDGRGYTRALYGARRPGTVRRLLLLGVAALLLEACFLALVLALARPPRMADALQRMVPGLLPLLLPIYRLAASHTGSLRLASVAGLNPATSPGRAYCVLAILLLAMLLVLGSALLARHGAPESGAGTERSAQPALLCLVLLATLLFGATLVCAPAVANTMSQELLWYGLYGRMIVLYHLNPYLVNAYIALPTLVSHDMLSQAIAAIPLSRTVPAASLVGLYGPLWLDVCLLVALFAREHLAYLVIGFRLVGLAAHIFNSLLLWSILTRWKPELRASAVLLYAWNPLILVLGVAQMHVQIVVTLFLLLATFFFLRSSPLLGWLFVVLSALLCPLYLLLLPLFVRLLARRAERLRPMQRLLWWTMVCLVTLLMLLLAYAPYWQGWGVAGVMATLDALFVQQSAVNSLSAAFLDVPLPGFVGLAWLLAPPHWSLLAVVILGGFLLFSYWFANTLELVVLCASWILLFMVLFQPIYWPWLVIVPFALTLCSANRSTMLLATLLALGAVLAYARWLWLPAWPRLALLTIGMPLLLWGWLLFFHATWRMTRAKITEEKGTRPRIKGLSRPPWPSRPSRR